MKTTRKIFLALVLTLAVAAVMSVCAFAFDIYTDLPSGVTNEDSRWINSGYTDVDTEDGWYMMSSGTADYSTPDGGFPAFASLNSARFYWNKTTNEAVWLVTSANMSGDSGEEAVVSLKDVTAATQKKFYAYASCFVDVTNKANNAIKTAIAGGAAEATQYVTQNASKHPIYERYITSGKASKQWSDVIVTAEAYAGFVAYKVGLGYAEDAAVSDTAHQDLLVEYVYTNIAHYKNLRNCKEEGALYRMAWIFKQLEDNNLPFASLEFRAAKGITPYFGTVGLVTTKIEATKILFDSNIEKISFTNNTRGLFMGNAALKTLAHVTYNEDGTYAETVEENVVDLTGFTQVADYVVSGKTYHLSEMLMNAGMTKMVWFATLMDGDLEYAGVIDNKSVQGAKNLEEIIIPASVTLKQIKTNAFNGCSALKVIDVKGVVADDLTIDATAFAGVSGLTVKVYSDIDKANMEKALADAGVSATVEATKVDEPGEGDAVAIPNVITADGFMLRTQSYNGLRALFSFDEDKATAVAAETGFELVEYGAIAASAKNFEAAGDGKTLLTLADGKKIQRIVIFADDGTGLNKYVDVDAKQYCIAVRDFEGANTLKEIYVAGYAMWSNGTDTAVTISEYVSPKVNKTISLYTLTLEMFKAGVINSQLADEICVWDVLRNGAFSVTEEETKAPSDLLTLTQGYEYDAEGKFAYVDLPLRAWNMYKNASGNTVWNSRGVTVEENATTGILWSVLVDGDSLVVVYRADEEFEGTATLPKLNDSYGASAPFSEKYFRVADAKYVTEDPTANGLLKTATIYSPIFTDANSAKIKTIVVDYGVDKFGQQSLTSASVTTIVYPEGMTSETYLLSGCTGLKNFTYATADKTYLEAYDVESLVDLTGLAQVSDYGLTQNAAAIENILLPEAAKLKNGQQYGFGGAKALTRVWTVGFDIPEAGVMDLSQTGIKMICKGYFNTLDNIDVVIMPESFTGIGAYSMATTGQTTDTARWNVFGNNSSETKLNIHVFNWNALNCIANTFYEARQNPEYNNGKADSGIEHYVDLLQITYEGVTKTVLEWRADFPAQPAA